MTNISKDIDFSVSVKSHSKESEIMASLDNLTAVLTELGNDVADLTADVSARLASLQASIDELKVGQVTQQQIDDLTAQAAAIDAAIDELDTTVESAPTAVVPVEEPVV